MTIDIEAKLQWAKKHGVSAEDLELMRLHYRRARLFRKGIGTSNCGRCGNKFHRGSVVCRTCLMWVCISCYDQMFVEVS